MAFGLGFRRSNSAAQEQQQPPESPLPSDASTAASSSVAAPARSGFEPSTDSELTVSSNATAPAAAAGNRRQSGGSTLGSLLAAAAAAASSADAADDKAEAGRGAGASVEEEVVVDRGGSQGTSSSSSHGSGRKRSGSGSSSISGRSRKQPPALTEGEEGKEELGAGDGGSVHKPAPELAARPRARSLPTVLRSSYRGDWRHLLRRLKRRSGGDDDSSAFGASDDDDDDEPRGPPSIISSLQASIHDVQASAHSFLHTVEDRFHRMPKWQYRLLLGSLIFLLCAMALLAVISVVYGFGMTYPHITLTKLELALPFPHLDADGAIPVSATVTFNNPNQFSVRTEPATVKIYSRPERTADTLLGSTGVPGLELRAHGEDYRANADFSIKNVGGVTGGQALVEAVLKGTHSFLYTGTDMDVVVKSLGVLPIHRTFQADCKILKVWGGDSTDVLLSDCYGRFGRSRRRGSRETPTRRLRGGRAGE